MNQLGGTDTPDNSDTPITQTAEDLEHLDTEFSGQDMTLGRIVIFVIVGLAVAASFGVWGYAYSGRADRRTPDLLDEPSFAAAAGPICDAAMAQFAELPQALDAVDNVDRANQIRATNQVLGDMVEELQLVASGTARDVDIISEWLADWRTYIGNRDDFANRFEVDEGTRFYVASVGGERLERRIPRFADTNEIFTCVPPEDIG